MTESGTKRGRWPWIALATAVLFVGGPLAYRLRPLNAAERSLVGHWAASSNIDELSAIYYSDRTFKMDGLVGSWSASNSAISTRTPMAFSETAGMPWQHRVSLYLGSRLFADTVEIRWDGPDRFHAVGTYAAEGEPELSFSRSVAEPPVR